MSAETINQKKLLKECDNNFVHKSKLYYCSSFEYEQQVSSSLENSSSINKFGNSSKLKTEVINKGHILQEVNIIDSTEYRFYTGRRPIVVDTKNDLHLFFAKTGEETDYVYHVVSEDKGASWSEPEIISVHTHPNLSMSTYSRYHIDEVSAAIDNSDNFHIIYSYEGNPLYHSSWAAYPSNHINYVSNESGEWNTFRNVLNDSLIQTEQGNGQTVSYLNDPMILSRNGDQYFAATDYAWWAPKYNFAFAAREDDEWTEAHALHTIDRGEIDRRTLQSASLMHDSNNMYALWFNRYTAEIRGKTQNGTEWTTPYTIHQSTHPGDPIVRRYYDASTISGNESCKMILGRSDHEMTLNKIYVIEKNSNGWDVDSLTLLDSLYALSASQTDKDLNIYYEIQTANGHCIKFVQYDESGFSEPARFRDEYGDSIFYFIGSPETKSGPLVYQTVDREKGIWYLKTALLNPETDVDYPADQTISTEFSLFDNYPNPFNSRTIIRYTLPKSSAVKLDIYDIKGGHVKTLVKAVQNSGRYEIEWNGKDGNNMQVSSGVYFYQLKTNKFHQVKSMLYIK
ncbi:MAG: T9SS type A sorting domain-containing protein [Candidatus Marinimicrobia bacterium]|nr:T9SS type A sorting domain-containing protein [Candidatus Neomarinimicrobiota bacterium]